MTSPRSFAWIEAGLAIVRDEGPSALTVDRVCRAMGRTKGSFYHHFSDIDRYHEAILAAWRLRNTAAPMEAARAGGDVTTDPAAAGDRLATAIAPLDQALDRAVRGWALHSPTASEAVATVDAERLAFLTELHTAAGVTDPAEHALREYALFLGYQALGIALVRK